MTNLIEQWEEETGQRWDSNDGDNLTMAGIMGTMSRLLGKSNQQPKDDLVAGMLIQHQMSPEGQRQAAAEEAGLEAFMMLLDMGVSPDTARQFLK
jgi:hypothetical protein